ncbi:MAG: hypothetical protein V4671_09670 [Armatimonadota bacterium]
MSEIEAESDNITTLEQGIWALLNRAQILADAVQSNQGPELLAPLAMRLRSLFDTTVSLGKPVRETLPTGMLLAIHQANEYLEEAIRLIKRGEKREQVAIQTQALVDTLKGLI